MDYIGHDEPMSRVGRFRIVEGITLIQETCDHIMNFRRRLFAGGSSTKTKHQMESGLLLDVVVREGTAVLELLSSENQTLLIRWNSFLVLDLGLDVLDRVGSLNIKGDGLSGKGLDENL